jgi:hypothetical protein
MSITDHKINNYERLKKQKIISAIQEIISQCIEEEKKANFDLANNEHPVHEKDGLTLLVIRLRNYIWELTEQVNVLEEEIKKLEKEDSYA